LGIIATTPAKGFSEECSTFIRQMTYVFILK